MTNHERDKALCCFFNFEGLNGCAALDVQRCSNCNFFLMGSDYLSNKSTAMERFRKSKKYARLSKKYYDKTGGINYEEEKK